MEKEILKTIDKNKEKINSLNYQISAFKQQMKINKEYLDSLIKSQKEYKRRNKCLYDNIKESEE